MVKLQPLKLQHMLRFQSLESKISMIEIVACAAISTHLLPHQLPFQRGTHLQNYFFVWVM